MQRQGLILAAGLGSRLGERDTLKPLVEIEGKALIIRAMKNLELAGCGEIVIVLGYASEQIQQYIENHYSGSSRITFAFNEKYHLSNGVSVLLAKSILTGDFVLSMSDHLFSQEIPKLIKNTPSPNRGAILYVDYKIDTIFDLDDATKVLTKDDAITSIGKEIKKYNCIDTGIFLCTRDLLNALQEVYDQQGDASLSEGIDLLSGQGIMKAIDIGEAMWQDVDDQAMLEHAIAQVRSE